MENNIINSYGMDRVVRVVTDGQFNDPAPGGYYYFPVTGLPVFQEVLFKLV